jgi:tetratricopeptide (TPR) repeat protein
MKNGNTWAALCAALAVTVSLAAHAQANEPERPWAKGVSKDRQTKALALFREGNASLKESVFATAADKYREALAVWDHPAVHYNLALSLVNLDKPLEVHEHLTAALKYGPAPLDDDKYQQAQRYLALIERQLTKLKITCSVDGATVRIDGNPIFTAPGEWEGLVRAGNHVLSASKEGFLPDERSLVFAGGDSQKFDLRVFKAEELTEYRRAFSPVIPWTALGLGVAAIGTGVGLHLSAANGYREYDQQISGCSGSDGSVRLACQPTTNTQTIRTNADGMQSGGIALYAVGGVALAASAVLFYVGRPVAYQRNVTVEAPRVTVAPILTPSVTGATALIEF